MDFKNRLCLKYIKLSYFINFKERTSKERKIMATRPAAKTIGINMKKELADEIEKRAKSMHLSTGKYCKLILGQWLASGKKLKLEEC